MAAELIGLGVVKTMTQNTIYALPARLCNFTVYTAAGTVQVSNDQTNWQSMTLDSNKNFTSAAAFAKSINDSSVIIAKCN